MFYKNYQSRVFIMKSLMSFIAGVMLTSYIAYDLNHTFDWSGGAGLTPRDFVARYVSLAYDRGQGAAAAQEYFSPNAVDHLENAVDRHDGTPIPHQVEEIVADGMTVAVVHRIEASRGQPPQLVVDIFKTARGKITERRRISQSLQP